MENILNLKLMKNKLFVILSLSFIVSYSQVSKPIIFKNTTAFSKDRYDNIYYVTSTQDVKKYGNDKLIYSPQRRKEVTNIEAWNSIRIFLFSKEFQEYTILDKYLTVVFTRQFNIENVGFASFATLALDGNVWLFDNSDFSIKKINIQNGNTILSTPLNIIIKERETDIIFMKEHGNFLYASTVKNGILVFDNLGTFKKKLPFNNISFFDFNDKKLYFNKENKAIKFDLFSFEIEEEESISINKTLITKENKFVIK